MGKKARVIEIKDWRSGSILYSVESESLKDAVASAIANRADLRWSDLRGSNLSGSNLRWSNLSGSNLRWSNLSGSDLSGSNLRWSNLSGSNLRWSNLSGSDLSGSNLPSPTTVLLATWGDLSQQLCADLMLFDSENHPDPTAFDHWASGGGSCPYSGDHVERAANFQERKELWGKGEHCRPYDLMVRVLAEKCPEWTDEQCKEFAKKFEKVNR